MVDIKKCPVCNERDGWVGVGGNFVCGECVSVMLNKRKEQTLKEMRDAVHRVS